MNDKQNRHEEEDGSSGIAAEPSEVGSKVDEFALESSVHVSFELLFVGATAAQGANAAHKCLALASGDEAVGKEEGVSFSVFIFLDCGLVNSSWALLSGGHFSLGFLNLKIGRFNNKTVCWNSGSCGNIDDVTDHEGPNAYALGGAELSSDDRDSLFTDERLELNESSILDKICSSGDQNENE